MQRLTGPKVRIIQSEDKYDKIRIEYICKDNNDLTFWRVIDLLVSPEMLPAVKHGTEPPQMKIREDL